MMRRFRALQPEQITGKVERAILDSPGWTYGYEIYAPEHPDLPPQICGYVWKNGMEFYGSGRRELVMRAEPPERGPREKDEAFAARCKAAEAVRRDLNTQASSWPAQMLAEMEAVAREQSKNEREQAEATEAAAHAQASQDDIDLALFLACERGRIIATQRGIFIPSLMPAPPRPQEQSAASGSPAIPLESLISQAITGHANVQPASADAMPTPVNPLATPSKLDRLLRDIGEQIGE